MGTEHLSSQNPAVSIHYIWRPWSKIQFSRKKLTGDERSALLERYFGKISLILSICYASSLMKRIMKKRTRIIVDAKHQTILSLSVHYDTTLINCCCPKDLRVDARMLCPLLLEVETSPPVPTPTSWSRWLLTTGYIIKLLIALF